MIGLLILSLFVITQFLYFFPHLPYCCRIHFRFFRQYYALHFFELVRLPEFLFRIKLRKEIIGINTSRQPMSGTDEPLLRRQVITRLPVVLAYDIQYHRIIAPSQSLLQDAVGVLGFLLSVQGMPVFKQEGGTVFQQRIKPSVILSADS